MRNESVRDGMKKHKHDGNASSDQHELAAVEMSLKQALFKAGRCEIQFELADENGTLIAPADLEIGHEKVMHVLIFDNALKEFFHVHPNFHDGSWFASFEARVSGNYQVWAQGVLKNSGSSFNAHGKIRVENGAMENSLEIPKGPVLNGESSLSLVEAEMSGAHNSAIMLRFKRRDDLSPELSSYLGALAHVIGVSTKTGELIHLHPMNHGNQKELMVHASFPEAGMYRLWVEFIDRDELKTVALWIQV